MVPAIPNPSRLAASLFLGVALADRTRRAVQLHLGSNPLPGRPALPEDWHLTLRFLGETSMESLERLGEVLGTADMGSQFNIGFGRLGAFPDPSQAGTLWLGVDEGREDLTTLASRVESATRRAGFPAGALPFRPHVTLSRSEPPLDVRGLVGRVPSLSERMAVDAVVLFRRRLGRGVGRYEEVERYPLRDPN